MKSQFLEHAFILLRAADDQSASKKALSLARKKQHSYLNAKRERVKWVLEKVVKIKEIFDRRLQEGTEVFYWFSSRRVEKPGMRARRKRRRRATVSS